MSLAKTSAKQPAAAPPKKAAVKPLPVVSTAVEHVAFELMESPAAPTQEETEAKSAAADVVTETAPYGVIIEDGLPTSEGQINRTAFMDRLGPEIQNIADELLKPIGKTALDCPYLSFWLDYYRQKSAAHIERAIAKYVNPDQTDLASIEQAILAHVRDAVQAWVERRAIQVPGEIDWSVGDDKVPETSSDGAVVQRMGSDGHGSAAAPGSAAAIRGQLSDGSPLDSTVRTRMERGFGTSFGGVRIHTDQSAASTTRAYNARAFAIGQDVAFGAGEYRPGTLSGDLLLAHELAHTIQQRGGSQSGNADIAGASLENEADLVAGRAIAKTQYPAEAGLFPEIRSTGRGLRLARCTIFKDRDERDIDRVRKDLEEDGDLGPKQDLRPLPPDGPEDATKASPLSVRDQAKLSANPPPLTTPEMILDLGSIEAQLSQIEPLVKDRPAGAKALAAARAQLTSMRAGVAKADVAIFTRRISRSRVVLEQTVKSLTNLQIMSTALGGPEVFHAKQYGTALTKITDLFDVSLGRTLQDDVLERFQEADRAAAQLPHALIEADLDAFSGLKAGAAMLQPAIKEIQDWAARLKPRLAAIEKRAAEVAAARKAGSANLQKLEAQFRDESDSLKLSLEALSYWEQLARGYAYLAGNPPYDINAIDSIARLMTRVRHMRDADDKNDVALLEVLVRQYRDDEDVHNFINNLGIFVAFSRFAVSMGIILAASIASAGVGAAATAAIGTTTTTAGAVTAFVGVTALEAFTFTAVSRGLQSATGQTPQGSFWTDLAWNFGLFSIMKLSNFAAARATASVGIPSFTRLVQHATAYPLLVGYGAIHQLITTGEWPTTEQFNKMSAETLFMMAGFAIVTGRFRGAASQPKELKMFRDRYGLQFETLNAGRQELSRQVMNAANDTTANKDAVTADTSNRARILETNLKTLLDKIRRDADISLPDLRNAVKGFGSATEAFALQIRMMDAGLTGPDIAAVEARIEALPELLRDPVRVQMSDATEYATRVVTDVAVRRGAIDMMSRAATNRGISGFADWVRFSTAQRPGVNPTEQARNLLDDIGELQVADTMTRTIQKGESVQVGGDAHAKTNPTTGNQMTSFDITVTGSKTPRNVEVYSPGGDTPVVGDFGTAINHAADKVIADPSLPANYQTTGRVEAAIRVNWPPPSKTTSGGTIATAANGDVTLTISTGAGPKVIDKGNFFKVYETNLNSAKSSPTGAKKVNSLTVYDRSGKEIYRYTRDPGTNVWTGALL